MNEIHAKLFQLQNELKAPKSQHNAYGNYNYRSCEDIMEAVKPLLVKNKLALTMEDTIIMIGSRYYCKSTANLVDTESGQTISTSSFAREPEIQKGMTESQITGTASSYARKYCLAALFLLDDTKDADTNEYQKTTKQAAQPSTAPIEVFCQRCGKPIVAATSKTGKHYTAEDLIALSSKFYGSSLCYDCSMSAEKNRKEKENA